MISRRDKHAEVISDSERCAAESDTPRSTVRGCIKTAILFSTVLCLVFLSLAALSPQAQAHGQHDKTGMSNGVTDETPVPCPETGEPDRCCHVGGSGVACHGLSLLQTNGTGRVSIDAPGEYVVPACVYLASGLMHPPPIPPPISTEI